MIKNNRTIYTPMGIDGFELCNPVNQDDFEIVNLKICGLSQLLNWKPIKVKLISKDQGNILSESDSPWLGSHVLIFRESVVQKMQHFLEKYGELLPLEEKSINLFIFNPWLCKDALDSTNSQMMKLSNGKILQITKYAFNEGRIDGLHAFKIPDLRVSPVFLTQEFVNEWKASGFKGLDFIEIWHST